MTPIELAVELNVDPRTLRSWLRRNHPRPPGHEGQRWPDLSTDAVAAARRHFVTAHSARSSAASERVRTKKRSRTVSDESYVIDLCDEALGEKGRRQHRFDWLLGDLGQRGRTRLPVDAYYPGHGLVVEYRERQHDEPVAFMDKKLTISGVDRGEQRHDYDRRREQLIPEHGLRLIVIRPSDLRADSRGRLSRGDRGADLSAIHALISESPHTLSETASS